MPSLKLNNSYFLMRHGRSKANERGLIVSSITHGGRTYGLTPEGREQVRQALKKESRFSQRTIIISSDFLRTRETALLAAEILQTPHPGTSELLRERNFGSCEMKSDRFYNKVWEEDLQGVTTLNVESPEEVQDRFRRFMEKTEARFRGEQILLISHGDLLQIALTWGAGISAQEHRSLPHLNTAEIRPFPAEEDRFRPTSGIFRSG